MHIGLAGAIATDDAAALIDGPTAHLPRGSAGSPLLVTLIDALLRRGHRVSAFTLSNEMPLRADSSAVGRGRNFALHYCPSRPRAWPPNGWRPGRITDLYAFERAGLRRAIHMARPDIVHAHWSYEYAWAALQTGLPHLVTCHDSPFDIARFERNFRQGGYRWLRAGIAWHVLRNARRVTSVSPYMAGRVAPLCREAVHVVANPIAQHVAVGSPMRRGSGFRVLMACNGWGARKNSLAGLQAHALLQRRIAQAELHFFGHDAQPQGPAWQAWRDLDSPASVVFHGPVAHSALRDAMATSDLLLHPALEESFGAVLAEAMSAGLPVVAGQASGAVPWVVGDAGILVDVTDPRAMADAMATLLLDPSAARAMGRSGRERVRSAFGPDTIAAQYEQHYEAVARQPRAAGR